MKIAILGTRGIPNNYGGFEQNAEHLSVIFARAGHEVTVYNPDDHPYKEREWKGVAIQRVFCSEKRLQLGIWGTLLYDYLCLAHAVKRRFDIILELGYVPSAVFFGVGRPPETKLITNMDGLEWQRAKWNAAFKRYVRLCERKAVELSDALISDNLGIRDYLKETYARDSFFIPYGSRVVEEPRREDVTRYGLGEYDYYMAVARLEPENNIEMVLDGYLLSGTTKPFVVVGGTSGKYGQYLERKYRGTSIRFLGGIYDFELLSSLRWFSEIYFHGHSVGGTAPSLLEAMASSAYIAAYDCVFNRHVLDADAKYFGDPEEVCAIIRSDGQRSRESAIRNNRRKIQETYNWERIAAEYLRVFEHALRPSECG